MNRRAISVLTVSHLFLDLSPGILPALLPFLIAERHFSYAAAGTLVLVFTLTSSFVQPFFGQFADRQPSPWLMPVGLTLAGGGVTLAGWVPSYEGLLVWIGVAGIGSAAFHPEAARMVNRLAQTQQATGMSWFSVGGNLGFALGPLLATGLLVNWGLHSVALLFIPVLIMAGLLLRELPQLKAATTPQTKQSAARVDTPEAWGAFICLSLVIVLRSMLFFGLNTFLPLYWIDVLQQSRVMGGIALTVLLLAGASGTLLGGWLADRYGKTTVVLGSLGLLPMLLALFLAVPSLEMGMALLIPIGLVLFAPMSVMIVMGQGYLPNRVGVASGVTIGLAGSLGGLITPFLGGIADHQGVHTALLVLLPLALVALLLAFWLPRPAQTVLTKSSVKPSVSL
jgi:MFS transporter, FSR family, fosmidomycin resistance protein